MAIKSLQIKNRISSLANSKDTSKVVLAEFRSPEEVMEYIKSVNKSVDGFLSKIKTLKDLFTKYSAKSRISKRPWTRDKQTAGSKFKKIGMSFNSEEKFDLDSIKRQSTTTVKDPRKPAGSSKITNITLKMLPTDLQKLNTKTVELSDMYQHLEKLDSILASLSAGKYEYQVKQTLTTTALMKEANAVRKKTQSAIDAAEKFLSGVAKKNAPEIFTDTVEKCVNIVLDKYSDHYTDFTENLYLTTVESTPPGAKKKKYDLKFVHYLNVELENDEIAAEDVFLVYTGIVDMDRQTLTMYVTFYNSFVPPDKVEFGRNLFSNANEAAAKSLALLATNAFEAELETVPLPQTNKKLIDALKKHPWIGMVSNIKVSNENIYVKYKSDVKRVEIPPLEKQIVRDVAVLLYSLVPDKQKPKVKVKTYSSGSRGHVSKIYLGIPTDKEGREGRIDALLLQKLRELFPFTDDQVRQIVRMVNY